MRRTASWADEAAPTEVMPFTLVLLLRLLLLR